MDLQTIFILLLTGLSAGILAGFVGVGGGVIIVPAMIFFLGMSQHMAQGTSLAMMIPPIGILAVWNYHRVGEIDIPAAIVLALAFVIGGYLGSKMSLRLNPAKVRLIFGVFMIFIAIRLIITGWKQLEH